MLNTLQARRRPILGIAGALVVLAALAGCSTSMSHPVTDYKGEPKGVVPPASSAGGAAYAVWLKGGAQFAIVLYGSSTCPPTVASVETIASNQLKATPAPITGSVCTQDYVPHTTVFATPSSVTTTSDVTIKLPDSTLTLPGLRG
ncbi:hypothetical protein G3T36_01930 [Diaminobutyricibacter tongyongensis]|uniref:Uncharacterized protein n=1 Tax=Leifsonia tongyongensis TaxID=1268043 RepID=A0A6L9XT88_9MICO|nr:hypothetical protein [Diaminobutyricibacter tongyongensis]NEN04622.1 hypothetical protein [Diaminobutyricibacter tongyongensis]